MQHAAASSSLAPGLRWYLPVNSVELHQPIKSTFENYILKVISSEVLVCFRLRQEVSFAILIPFSSGALKRYIFSSCRHLTGFAQGSEVTQFNIIVS